MSKYDPRKQYKWERDTKFEMDGNEFGLILNTFRTILKSREAQEILLINEANNVIENVLGKAVDSGVVNEAPSESVAPSPPTPQLVKEES